MKEWEVLKAVSQSLEYFHAIAECGSWEIGARCLWVRDNTNQKDVMPHYELRLVEVVGWSIEINAAGSEYVRSYLVLDLTVPTPVPTCYPVRVLVEELVSLQAPGKALDAYKARIAALKELYGAVRKKMFPGA